MQLGQHPDGGVLQFALTFGGRVGEPVAAEGVGHDVGRHHTVDVVHQEEGCSEDVAGGLEPAHARDGDVGQLADRPYHLELVVESIRGKDLHVLGGRRHPGHQLLLDLFGTGCPPCCQRAVRMMVSDDMPVESMPLSTVTSGFAPPGSTVDSHCDITAGTVVTSRLER